MTWCALPVAIVLFAMPGVLQGQGVTPVASLRPGQEVLFTLRAVVRAQEAYQLDNTRYASDAAALRFRAEPGVRVTVLYATQRGWAGQATHAAIPRRTCVVYFGYLDPSVKVLTEFEGRRPKREGEPACDSFEA
jgi:hypothetical protein